jgi:hypothetical protein
MIRTGESDALSAIDSSLPPNGIEGDRPCGARTLAVHGPNKAIVVIVEPPLDHEWKSGRERPVDANGG